MGQSLSVMGARLLFESNYVKIKNEHYRPPTIHGNGGNVNDGNDGNEGTTGPAGMMMTMGTMGTTGTKGTDRARTIFKMKVHVTGFKGVECVRAWCLGLASTI